MSLAVPDPLADGPGKRPTDEILRDVERWAAELRRVSDEMRAEAEQVESESTS